MYDGAATTFLSFNRLWATSGDSPCSPIQTYLVPHKRFVQRRRLVYCCVTKALIKLVAPLIVRLMRNVCNQLNATKRFDSISEQQQRRGSKNCSRVKRPPSTAEIGLNLIWSSDHSWKVNYYFPLFLALSL